MHNNAIHVLGIKEIRNNDSNDSLWLHQASTKDRILFVLLSTSWNWGKMSKIEVTTKNPMDLRVVVKILKHEAAMH